MPVGYNGKILRVDLTQRNISIEETDENFYRRYMGGTALIAYYLLKELKPGIDPYGPENRLIFAPGVITGAPLGGAGRNAVGAKSPMTGGFATAEAGGFFGAEVKHAGFDAVIVQGKSDKPVYIWIQDGKAEIKDASQLWGKPTAETQQAIRQEMGDNLIRTALIGPGGENMVRFACIANDLGHFAGRDGLGAVMGSKKLKGIAVRGHNIPAYASSESLQEIAKGFRERMPVHPYLQEYHEIGTLGGVSAYSQLGGLVTKNFQEGVFPGAADKIAEETYMKTIRTGRGTCYGCALQCKQEVKTGAPYSVDPKTGYHGPEYESLVALGSNCGIDDLAAISKANELCAAYTIDTISTGVTIAFAMECFQRGILTEKDTGGLKLNFGDAAALVKATEMIAKREGFGGVLAEGSLRAAKKIGKGSEVYAMHCKGSELPMHNPYFKPITGVGYALSPTGADHLRNIMSPQGITKPGISLDMMKPFGLAQPLPRDDYSSPARMRQFTYISNWRAGLDSLGFCYFSADGYRPDQIADMVRGITGWSVNVWEIMKVGERCQNMMRAFNNREGMTRKDDKLPERFFQPVASGPLKGFKLEKDKFNKAIDTYFEMMSWSKDGVPSKAKLQELDIEWVSELK